MENARHVTTEMSPAVPLLVFGSLLVIAGYFLPWVTYHLEGGFLVSTVNGWDAVLGNGGIFSFAVGGTNLSTPVGWLLFLLLPFPPLMALMALALCFFTPSSPASGSLRSLILWRIFWPVVILGALELLSMSYLLDPFGLNRTSSQWALRGDPPPYAGTGLYLVYAGWILVMLAGLLIARVRFREPRTTP
jgi:hypothetical protein